MSVKREYRKAERTPEQLAELRAVRAHYQATKPTLGEAAAATQAAIIPLGEVIELHGILAELKKERVRQQITLTQMAERIGMDAGALSKLENGHAPNPTVGTISRIAAALGKMVGWVLRDTPRSNDSFPCPSPA